MAATTTTAHEAATKSADEDTRDGARTVSKRAAKAQDMASEAGYSTLQPMSRMVYTGSYALAYGVVYATVFVAQSLPQENPIMHGFRDGGRAAMDELGAGLSVRAERQPPGHASAPRSPHARGVDSESQPSTFSISALSARDRVSNAWPVPITGSKQCLTNLSPMR
jgi:hypothetical protein